jgi:hypothetical protein
MLGFDYFVIVLPFAWFAWPFALAIIVRALQWPQLARPLALTIIAIGLKPLYCLLGVVLAVAWTGDLQDKIGGSVRMMFRLAVNPVLLVDVALLPYSLFLGLTLWQSDNAYHRLAPKSEQRIPVQRTIGGWLSLVISLGYTSMLAGSTAWYYFISWGNSQRG